MKKIYKYGTGQPIPEGAVYLSTIVGTTIEKHYPYNKKQETWRERESVLVWHYFLVEVEDE